MSRDQNSGYLLYIGDEQLPSYIGILLRHEIRIRKPGPIRISWFMSADSESRCEQMDPEGMK